MQFRWGGKVAYSVDLGNFPKNVFNILYTYTRIFYVCLFFSALIDVDYDAQCNVVRVTREKCIQLSIDQF